MGMIKWFQGDNESRDMSITIQNRRTHYYAPLKRDLEGVNQREVEVWQNFEEKN